MTLWHPANFVLRGEYCPTESIEEQLETYRKRYGLDGLAVTAWSVKSGLVPTVVSSTAPNGSSRPMEALLAALPVAPHADAIAESVFAPGSDREEALRDAALGLLRLVGLGEETELHLYSPARMSNNQPVRPMVVALGRAPHSIAAKHLDLLFTMIATHINVRQAIDTAALSPLDELLLIPAIDDHGNTDVDKMARRARHLAMAQTASDDCVVFWRAIHNPWVLKKPTPRIRRMLACVEPLADRQDALLAEMYSIPFARQYFGERGVLLAAPIPGVLAGPHTPAAGVMILLRKDRSTYTSHATNLVRAVCLRLAVIRATAASGEVARIIAELGSLPLGSVDDVRDDSGGPIAQVPHIFSALAGMSEIFSLIAANTNSHSISVRIAVGHADATEPHGFVLQRVFPPQTAQADQYQVLLEGSSRRGVNWRTVLEGQVNYVANVHDDDDYVDVGRRTASQLSVPIRAAGLLIGTLNLESPSAANYGAFLPYVEGIAGAIGRRFADASQAVSRPILERAALVLDRTHDYQGHLVRLQEHARDLPLREVDIQRIDDYIIECLALIRSATIERLRPAVEEQSVTLEWVVKAALRGERVLNLRVDGEPLLSQMTMQVDSATAGQLLIVLRSVLNNVRQHGGVTSSKESITPRLEVDSCIWDGSRFLSLRITNSSQFSIEPAAAMQVYQAPIDRGQGLRLGAYLAGLQMRQMGGNITFSMDRRSIARTVLLVPISAGFEINNGEESGDDDQAAS